MWVFEGVRVWIWRARERKRERKRKKQRERKRDDDENRANRSLFIANERCIYPRSPRKAGPGHAGRQQHWAAALTPWAPTSRQTTQRLKLEQCPYLRSQAPFLPRLLMPAKIDHLLQKAREAEKGRAPSATTRILMRRLVLQQPPLQQQPLPEPWSWPQPQPQP